MDVSINLLDDIRGPFPKGFPMPKGFSTKMAICHAIDRPIGTLSVDQICENCGITRRTFYNHFASKNLISVWFAQLGQTLYLDQIGSRYTCLEAYTRHLAFLQTEREMFYYTSVESDSPSRGLGNANAREESLLSALVNRCDMERTPALGFQVQLFVWGEAEMCRRWFKRHMDGDVETMADYLVRSMPQGFSSSLDAAAIRRRGSWSIVQ